MKTTLKRILLWTLSIILAIVYLISASGKFDPHGNMATNFQNWGYPVWLRIAVGIAETVGSIMLLIPRGAFYGAIVLLGVMGGAILTHFLNFSSMGLPLLPASLTVALLIVIRLRKQGQS